MCIERSDVAFVVNRSRFLGVPEHIYFFPFRSLLVPRGVWINSRICSSTSYVVARWSRLDQKIDIDAILIVIIEWIQFPHIPSDW